MSLPDKVVDLLEEHGAMATADIAALLNLTPKQAMNALGAAVIAGRAHRCGTAPGQRGPGSAHGLYTVGPAPGWLPKPLPANSIWQFAQRRTACS